VSATSDVAVVKAILFAGTQTVATWDTVELESMCELLPTMETMYTMQVTMAFTKSGHAKIEAQVVDPSGRPNGKPATYEFDGTQGDMKQTILELFPKQ
jgi:hypothetical protein